MDCAIRRIGAGAKMAALDRIKVYASLAFTIKKTPPGGGALLSDYKLNCFPDLLHILLFTGVDDVLGTVY